MGLTALLDESHDDYGVLGGRKNKANLGARSGATWWATARRGVGCRTRQIVQTKPIAGEGERQVLCREGVMKDWLLKSASEKQSQFATRGQEWAHAAEAAAGTAIRAERAKQSQFPSLDGDGPLGGSGKDEGLADDGWENSPGTFARLRRAGADRAKQSQLRRSDRDRRERARRPAEAASGSSAPNKANCHRAMLMISAFLKRSYNDSDAEMGSEKQSQFPPRRSDEMPLFALFSPRQVVGCAWHTKTRPMGQRWCAVHTLPATPDVTVGWQHTHFYVRGLELTDNEK